MFRCRQRARRATNPFYAAQRFAEALGARTSWDRVFTRPVARCGDRAVGVALEPEPRRAARRSSAGSKSGGRLVVDRDADRRRREFEQLVRASAATYPRRRMRPTPIRPDATTSPVPQLSRSDATRRAATRSSARQYWLCDLESRFRSLTSERTVDVGAARRGSASRRCACAVGRGSVTVINAAPFRYRRIFDGDHGWLFVAATQLRRGDDVHFLSEDDHPSLLALVWTYGGPVVVLALALVGLALWRGGVRFGPLAAAPPTGAALAGRADSRHRPVRAAPRRRRGAARGGRARARRSGRSAAFAGYAELCRPANAPRRSPA